MSTVKVDKIEGSTGNQFQIPKGIAYSANVSGNVSVARSLAVGYTDGRVPQANLEVKGNTYITGDTTIASLNSYQLAGRRNLVINGDQQVAQRGAQIDTAGDSTYGIDRFLTRDYGGDGRYTIDTLQTDVPTEGGFKYSTKYTCSTASTNTGSYGYGIETRIEGYDANRLMLGTAQAKPFTLSFWCKTSVGGTYTSAIRTASGEQSFVWEHTLAADTWTKVTKTILPLTSTLSSGQYTNSAMLLVSPINFGAQTSKNTTTLNAWQSGNYVFTSNQVHWMGNLNATFYMTGVQLEEGSVATPFEFLNYEEQFSACQRYFTRIVATGAAYMGFAMGGYSSTTKWFGTLVYPTTMRSSPTITFSNITISDFGANINPTSLATSYPGYDRANFQLNVASGGTQYRPAMVIGNNNVAAYVDLTAEF